MVGVAGKSKGCSTCRKRKIACDQNRPVCTQCTRSSRACGGYKKERTFVLVDPAAKRTHTFIKPQSLKLSPLPVSPQTGTESCVSSSVFGSSRTTTAVPSDRESPPLLETASAYKIIQRRSECYGLTQSFLSQCLPSRWPFSDPRSWMQLLGSMATKSDLLETSSAAVAASLIGRKSQNLALVKVSLNFYTRGLQQLQRALHNPSFMKEDETLAACMTLNLYEAIECPGSESEAYFNHCHGIIALIQARGASAHSSGAGHLLFLGARVPEILRALQCGALTVLADKIWMERPWSSNRKTLYDQVTDCLAEAPGILERVPLLWHLDVTQQLELVYELVHECLQVDEKLATLHDEMLRSKPDLPYWEVSSKCLSQLGSKVSVSFPVIHWFADPHCAATLILLWATRTMLWSGLDNLYRHFNIITAAKGPVLKDFESGSLQNSGSQGFNSLPSLDHRTRILSMAHRVCKSVDYFLQDDMLLAGPLSIASALGITIDALKNQPSHGPEIAWLQEALMVVQQKGIRSLKYMKS